MKHTLFAAGLAIASATAANAAIVSAVGGPSSAGTAPAVIAAPLHALDDIVTNTGQQGFNEAQGVTTTVAHAHDTGALPVGIPVDSHMIFLNSPGTTFISHYAVVWTFTGPILGIMSNTPGTLEAASTFELGAPGTNYTATFGGSGPAAPFAFRGIETNGGCSSTTDGYAVLTPFSLCVSMRVTEPGDWIRVVTQGQPTGPVIPVPAALPLMASALAGFGLAGLRRKRRSKA